MYTQQLHSLNLTKTLALSMILLDNTVSRFSSTVMRSWETGPLIQRRYGGQQDVIMLTTELAELSNC